MASCVLAGASQVEETHVATQEENESLTEEMLEIIVDLGAQYSNLTTAEEVGISDIEEQLKGLEKKILGWDVDKWMIWDRAPTQRSEFLKDVNEICEITQVLEQLHMSNKDEKHNDLLNFSERILQTAMARLEDELIQLLTRCCEPVEPGSMSFHSAEDESLREDFSSSSCDEESAPGTPRGDAIPESADVVSNSINHGLVSDITSIANLMFQSNYDKEFYHAYVMVRKDALEECLSTFQIGGGFHIEEVVRMEWNAQSRLLKKWNQAMHAFIWVYLAMERELCNLVFGDHLRSARESCFVEISKNSILQLLSVAMGIAIASPKPEKLFLILDTYETLMDIVASMEHFFPEDHGANIVSECQEVLLRLKESVSGIIEEFKRNIQSSISSTAFAGGGIHHLTKYVMNYITALSAYSRTLDLILEPGDPIGNSSSPSDGVRETSLNMMCPTAWLLMSVTIILEANLDSKSQLYKDTSLQNIFLMNNICYMVDKVKGSDLRNFFGDEWIRVRMRKFRMHAMDYQRASWNHVLSFLKEEGISKPGSNNPSLTNLKDRFRCFNRAFEEVYRTQTAWSVPNEGLRDDLKIAVSSKLMQAYRTFEGKYASHMDGERNRERYVKYAPDDLQEYVEDLFGESQKSLPCSRKK